MAQNIKLPYRTQHKVRLEGQKAVQDIVAKCGPQERGKGGHLRIFMVPEIPNPMFYDMIQIYDGWCGGLANSEKQGKYEILSLEKAMRLCSSHKQGHLSSFVSYRNPEFGLYGGAVKLPVLIPDIAPEPVWCITSFSGLVELGDETVGLLVNRRMGWLNHDSGMLVVRRIIQDSNNPFAPQFDELTSKAAT